MRWRLRAPNPFVASYSPRELGTFSPERLIERMGPGPAFDQATPEPRNRVRITSGPRAQRHKAREILGPYLPN
ncbi:hypothetical protein BS47DRAFT_1351861 [Hydnum rufescens UP504]|uniref:Uncharacterized protein n=1 Tax=Hydnum rufescens UP504 TaxID=1448309 RepID=A0A9P6DQD4_9AGAM|nr:hypothetical protein BS47DRAFT_1351861 [Hydnum rufescens UP504]